MSSSDVQQLADQVEIIKHGSGALEIRRVNNMVVIAYNHVKEFLKALAPLDKFAAFSDNEMVVIDCALADDRGSWHNEEKEVVLDDLIAEVHVEIAARGLNPKEDNYDA